MNATRCNACLRDVASDQIADPADHNTGGDTICLDCHREALDAEWYWLDGVPYCPACVEADDPCMGDEERERATRSPRSQWSCRCACCGEQS